MRVGVGVGSGRGLERARRGRGVRRTVMRDAFSSSSRSICSRWAGLYEAVTQPLPLNLPVPLPVPVPVPLPMTWSRWPRPYEAELFALMRKPVTEDQ